MHHKSSYKLCIWGLACVLLLGATFWATISFKPASEAAPPALSQQKLRNLEKLNAAAYPEDTYRHGEVVVMLEDSNPETVNNLVENYSNLIEGIRSDVAAASQGVDQLAVRLQLREGVDELQAARELVSSPLVQQAEPNIIFRADTTNPNDARYNQQWNLWDTYGVRANQAWDMQKGSPTLTLAVIDTGLDYNHEDLAGRRVSGYDFYNGDTDPIDDNGHGTMVSGVACANADNILGIAGLDWNAKIMPLKALNASGEGSLDDIVNAILWAAGNSADVINMSFTSPTYSSELESAVEYAHSQGCVMVAAGGNEGTSRIDYPAGLTYVIGVGSIGTSGTHSNFSNYNSSVDLTAPGENITGPSIGIGENRYVTGAGTSEASPHVAGAALLIKAEYPGASSDEIWRRLKDGARDLGDRGYDEQYGWGLLDINASLHVPLVTINSPSDFSYPSSGKVSADASDTPATIQYMELWVDDQLKDSVSVGPAYSVSATFNSWDLSQLSEGTHNVTVRASDGSGQWHGEQSMTVYHNESQPRPAHDWYLAEGTTNWGFEEYVLVQNPNGSGAQIEVTFMKPGGATQQANFSMPAYSRLTINVNSLVPSSDVSTHIHCDQDVIAERSMYWANRGGGHDAVGTNNPGTDWYLAEGSTAWGFEEYILIQNPNATGASIHVTFMKQGGQAQDFDFSMAGFARLTLPVNNLMPASDISAHVHSDQPIITERAMYWNNKDGGHCTSGVTEGSTSWLLAEGSTAWNFEEYVLVQNPNSTATTVDFDFMKPGGSQVRRSYSLAPFSRFTLNVASVVPGSDVSTFVQADQPVIAERAMYWPKGSRTRAEGHCSTGSVTAASTWYLAEGSTAWGFDEYVLLVNPTDDVAHATLEYMRTDGSTGVHQVTIMARARYTVHGNELDPNRDASVKVSSDFPLVVERAMYWSNKEGGTDALGVLEP